MTVMAAEAGTGAVEGEAAESSTAARRVTRRPPARRAAGRVVRATPQGRAATVVTSARPARRPPSRARRVAQSKPAKQLTGNYHGVVFGEWILAVLLVAAIPFSRPNRTGVSPYAGKDIVQLLAITVVYFLLAVLAATGRGQARFAAWFGGLLLLAVGLAEAAAIASAVNEWLGGGQSSQPSQPSGPKPNASAVNPGSTAPTGLSRPVAQEPGTGLS